MRCLFLFLSLLKINVFWQNSQFWFVGSSITVFPVEFLSISLNSFTTLLPSIFLFLKPESVSSLVSSEFELSLTFFPNAIFILSIHCLKSAFSVFRSKNILSSLYTSFKLQLPYSSDGI